VALEDIGTLIKIGLELFHVSQDNLYAQVTHYYYFFKKEKFLLIHVYCALFCCLLNYGSVFVDQVKWGKILVRLINKYHKKLSLKVQWRPFYDTLICTHFTRCGLRKHLLNVLPMWT
jgi:proteasome activator subunit 4